MTERHVQGDWDKCAEEFFDSMRTGMTKNRKRIQEEKGEFTLKIKSNIYIKKDEEEK